MDTDEHVGDLKPRIDTWISFEPQMKRMSTDEDVGDLKPRKTRGFFSKPQMIRMDTDGLLFSEPQRIRMARIVVLETYY